MEHTDRPVTYREALNFAKEVIGSDKEYETDFDVYLELSRIVVKAELDKTTDFPFSNERREQLIGQEAYSRAQPAHLKDNSVYRSTELLGLLNSLWTDGTDAPEAF